MKQSEATGIKGIYKITECDSSSKEAQEMIAKIKAASGKTFDALIKEFHRLFAIREEVFHNIVPNVGLNALAENIVNSSPSAANALKVTYAGLGTGTATPAGGDTALGSEQYRQAISSQTRSGAVAYSTLFVDNGSGNGNTYTEFGLFAGDASATTDSGTMFSRVLISPSFEKTSAKTLTIEASHTFSSA